MARQEIILGTPPSGLGGDPPRVASQKINHMTQELYDWQAKLGTAAFASIVGSMASGAIIERGENASGSYVKLADGTMMTWGLQIINATVLPGQATTWDVGRQPMPFVGQPSHKIEMTYMRGANGTGDTIYTAMQAYATSGRQIPVGVNMGVMPSLSHPSYTYGTVTAGSYVVYFQSMGRWK